MLSSEVEGEGPHHLLIIFWLQPIKSKNAQRALLCLLLLASLKLPPKRGFITPHKSHAILHPRYEHTYKLVVICSLCCKHRRSRKYGPALQALEAATLQALRYSLTRFLAFMSIDVISTSICPLPMQSSRQVPLRISASNADPFMSHVPVVAPVESLVAPIQLAQHVSQFLQKIANNSMNSNHIVPQAIREPSWSQEFTVSGDCLPSSFMDEAIRSADKEVSFNHFHEIVEDNAKMMPAAFGVHLVSASSYADPCTNASQNVCPVQYGYPEERFAEMSNPHQITVVIAEGSQNREDHNSFRGVLPEARNFDGMQQSKEAGKIVSKNSCLQDDPDFASELAKELQPQLATSLPSIKEMFYTAAAFQPVLTSEASSSKPRRRNTRISKDPQSVAARQRRERISQKIRTLQRLVPGGTKMDTASMLDEAIQYVKFLKTQVQSLEMLGYAADPTIFTSLPNAPASVV